jgi:hypothetical protein
VERCRGEGANVNVDDWACGMRGDGDTVELVKDGTGNVDIVL